VVGEGDRITLTSDDVAQDPETRHAGDIADHQRQLEVHLHQRLLHPMDVGRGALHQALPMAHIRPQRDNGLGGTKTPAEQPDAVELAQPLAVGHIALSPRDVLDVPWVHQQDVDTTDLEDFVDRNPIHAGGFHRHAGHPTGGEPVSES
jgi:hypothetical protein